MKMNENEAIDACDAPLLELQIQISAMWYDRKKLRVENKLLKEQNKRLKEKLCNVAKDTKK